MEGVPAAGIGFTEHRIALSVQGPVRRRGISGVEFQVLGHGVHSWSQGLQQSAVRRPGREDAPGEQDDAVRGHGWTLPAFGRSLGSFGGRDATYANAFPAHARARVSSPSPSSFHTSGSPV